MPPTFEDPADGTLVALFTGKALAATHKTKIKNTTGLILLSIQGNLLCQKNHLQLIIEQALKLHNEVTLLIGDELQWHNLRTGPVNDEETLALKEQAIGLGDVYLNDNLPYILNAIKTQWPNFNIDEFTAENETKSITGKIVALNQTVTGFGTPFQMVRWREWIENPAHDFASKQNDIMALFNERGTALHQSLEDSTNDYVRRKIKTGIIHQDEEDLLRDKSRGYIREESAAIMWIGAALGINVIAYPGKLMPVFQMTKKTFVLNNRSAEENHLSIIAENSDTLLNEVQIGFKTKKPQKMSGGAELPNETKPIEQSSCSSSPVSVSSLIQRYESLALAKSKGLKRDPVREISHDCSKRQSATHHQVRFFSKDPNRILPLKTTTDPQMFESEMMDETNEANIQKFITRINEQIQSFAVGLPSNDSRLLARALLAQGCNLLDRSTTPLLNLTS